MWYIYIGQGKFSRVRWGNLGLNWAFFEINSVSSQIRWKYRRSFFVLPTLNLFSFLETCSRSLI